MRFNNQLVVMTGGAGQALVCLFAAEGACPLISDTGVGASGAQPVLG